MREIRPSSSEGGATQTNASSLPLSALPSGLSGDPVFQFLYEGGEEGAFARELAA